jgi:hypothetical protein
MNWWLGDWLNRGEKRFGETYVQAIDETGMAYQTLANIKWVASAIDVSRRRENLTWKHHAEVAKLPPDAQDVWLGYAESFIVTTGRPMSASSLRKAIRDKAVKDAEQPLTLADVGHVNVNGSLVVTMVGDGGEPDVTTVTPRVFNPSGTEVEATGYDPAKAEASYRAYFAPPASPRLDDDDKTMIRAAVRAIGEFDSCRAVVLNGDAPRCHAYVCGIETGIAIGAPDHADRLTAIIRRCLPKTAAWVMKHQYADDH